MASHDCLVLDSPEENVLPYLDETIKGARACADAFIFEKEINRDEWNLHIMEFKKSINSSTISKSKWQLKMGFYNARAIAAFLGMTIRSTTLYSAYRSDKIASMSAVSLIELRAANHSEALAKIREWKSGKFHMQIDEQPVIMPHKKIPLDDDGNGKLRI